MRLLFVVIAAMLTLVGCGPQSGIENEETGSGNAGANENGAAPLNEDASELRRREGGERQHRGKYHHGNHHHGNHQHGNHGHGHDGHGHGGHGHGGHGHGGHDWDDCEEDEEAYFLIDGPELSPGKVCAGEQVSISTEVEASRNVEALVYLTVRNEDGDVVFERFFPQAFEAGTTYPFAATFLTDATTPPGDYYVTARVADPSTGDTLERTFSERLRVRDPRSRRCMDTCTPPAS